MKRPLSSLSSQNRREITIVILLAVFAFLLLFSLRAVQQTGDSLGYAISIKNGQDLFHPHHLLYNPLVRLLSQVISTFHPSCDAIFAAQIHNILWAIVTLLSLYFVVGRLLDSRTVGIIAACALLVTQGFWIFSTQVEVYIPATGCLALLTAIIMRRYDSPFTKKDVIFISLLLAMSVFYHETNVLFCVPLGYYLISVKKRRGLKIFFLILSVSGALVLLTYILVFVLSSGKWDIQWFLRFCMAYTLYPDTDWGNFANFSPIGIQKLINSQLWAFIIFPWRFKYVAIFLVPVILSILICHIIHIVKHSSFDKIRSYLLIWVTTYYLFFLWWLPEEREFFITSLIPLILLMFVFIKDIEKIVGAVWCKVNRIIIAVLVILVLFIAVVNLGNVLTLHRSRGDAYDKASRLAELVPQDCIILSTYHVRRNMEYYFDTTNIMTLPHLYFYFQEDLPDHYRFKGGECLMISTEFVVPEYSVNEFNGFSHPSEWLAFVEWLFNFEHNPEGKLIGCRAFEVVDGEEGHLYFIIRTSMMDVEGLRGLFRALDHHINRESREKKNSFQSWISNFGTDILQP